MTEMRTSSENGLKNDAFPSLSVADLSFDSIPRPSAPTCPSGRPQERNAPERKASTLKPKATEAVSSGLRNGLGAIQMRRPKGPGPMPSYRPSSSEVLRTGQRPTKYMLCSTFFADFHGFSFVFRWFSAVLNTQMGSIPFEKPAIRCLKPPFPRPTAFRRSHPTVEPAV